MTFPLSEYDINTFRSNIINIINSWLTVIMKFLRWLVFLAWSRIVHKF